MRLRKKCGIISALCHLSALLSLCATRTLVEWEGKQQESQVWEGHRDSLCMLFHSNQLHRVVETAEEELQDQTSQHAFKEWQGVSENNQITATVTDTEMRQEHEAGSFRCSPYWTDRWIRPQQHFLSRPSWQQLDDFQMELGGFRSY